jgi:hypothetical protein
VTRFKELKRIEDAIKNADKTDLVWADSYCAMRIKIATIESGKSYWRKIQKDVRNALADSN